MMSSLGLPLLVVTLAGLLGAGLARYFPQTRGVAASLAGILALGAGTGWPAFPPAIHVEILAWGLLPLGLVELLPFRTLLRGLVATGLLVWIQSRTGIQWPNLALLGLAAAFTPAQGPGWRERAEAVALGLLAMIALYVGDSLRVGMLGMALGLGMAAAGGGSRVWLPLLAGIGSHYANLSESLVLALAVLGASGLRHPAGWLAALLVLVQGAQAERL
jgi:hypothetical protein